MASRIDRRTTLLGCLVLAVIVATSGLAAATPGPSSQTDDARGLTGVADAPEGPPTESDRQPAQFDEEDEDEREGDEGDEDEEGASLLGDWWGLGEEARETPYVGLVELGVVVLGVGLGGYSLAKRTALLPPRYRRYLLPAHEWSMLLGTALTVPHFLGVEEWEGLGFAVGVLLGIEVISGLYGRHLHRHVIRHGRGSEAAPLLGRLVEISKRTVFSRWRRIHVLLTVVTALVLVLHVVTAVGD